MMNTSKRCKQCGRVLTPPNFRRYYPRGAATQKQKELKVGYNTVCKECEAFNAKVNYIYKLDKRTQEQQKLLDDAAIFYKELASRGLEPKGCYAAEVLVGTDFARHSASHSNDSIKDARNFMNNILEPTTNDVLVDEYNKLLKLDLTEEPDVYQEMLDKLREQSVGLDGRVRPEYKEIFTKVAERFDEYEDNYTW